MSRFFPFLILGCDSALDGPPDVSALDGPPDFPKPGCGWSKKRGNVIAHIGGIPDNNPDDLQLIDGPFCNDPYNTPLEGIVAGAPKVCYFGTVEDKVKGCTKEIYQDARILDLYPVVTLGLRCTAHNAKTDLNSCCRISYSMEHTFWRREKNDFFLSMKVTGLEFEMGVDVSHFPTPAFFDTTTRTEIDISTLGAKVESRGKRIVKVEETTTSGDKRIVSVVARIPFNEVGQERTSIIGTRSIPWFEDKHYHYRRRHTITGCEETTEDTSAEDVHSPDTSSYWRTNSAIDTPWEKRSGRAVWDLMLDSLMPLDIWDPKKDGIVVGDRPANVTIQIKSNGFTKIEDIRIPVDLLPAIIGNETKVEKIVLQKNFPVMAVPGSTVTIEDTYLLGRTYEHAPEFVNIFFEHYGEQHGVNGSPSLSLSALSIFFFVAF